jgi:hypothetical protein
MRAIPFLAALLLAGCAQLPPTPEDIQAKRFETVPDKAVIYIVRAPLDSSEASELFLQGTQQVSFQPRTYYRWEVPPGTYRITGMGAGAASATVAAAPGQLYFLKYTVIEDPSDGGVQLTALRPVTDRTGRDLVSGAELVR